MRRPVASLIVLLLAACLAATGAAAAPASSLVVQASAEPPGLDLTASPASAIAAVVFGIIRVMQGAERGPRRTDRIVDLRRPNGVTTRSPSEYFEERHGFAGARRAPGGLGGPWLGPPTRLTRRVRCAGQSLC